MDQVLYVQVMNTKLNELVELHEWRSEVKFLDNEKCFEHLQAIKAFKQSAAGSHAISCAHAASQPQNNVLAGPSRRANSGPSALAATDFAAKPNYPPKLTDEEKALLLKYDGCLTCHKPFVFHKVPTKPLAVCFLFIQVTNL
jgi:hypothetical protein